MLLDRVVGRDLQGDGAGPLEIAESTSLFDDDAREVFRTPGFFDESRRRPDTLLRGTGVVVIREQPPRNVFPLLAVEVQASITEVPAERASLGHGQGITRAGARRKDHLRTVPVGDATKNVTTAGAALAAPPGASTESEPSGGPRHLVRGVLPEKPRAKPGDSTRGPPSRNRGAARRGSHESEFPVFLCPGGEFPSVPPPGFFREVRPTDPNDVEVAHAQKSDVIGL